MLCQYNNIYANSYKYFFKREQTDDWKKRKKEKKANEVTVHIEQTKKYCSFYTFTQQVLQHFHKNIYFQSWLFTISYFIILFQPIRN